MKFTLYRSNFTGHRKNTVYPVSCTVTSAEELAGVVSYDHVAAEYKNNKRNNDDFEKSDCIMLDCDNTRSNKPEDWVSMRDLPKMFEGIAFMAVPSKNHLKEKENEAPRERFHVYFPIDPVYSGQDYVSLKARIQQIHPIFDKSAMDCARFFFGNPVSAESIIVQEGFKINKLWSFSGECSRIPEGRRNDTLHKFAVKLLKRFGNTEEALALFHERAKLCDPPLDDTELESIWRSALKFYDSAISKQDGYIPPEDFKGGENSLYIPKSLTSDGQLLLFSERIRPVMRYSENLGYMHFNGKVWEEDNNWICREYYRLLENQRLEANSLVAKAEEALAYAIGEGKSDIRRMTPNEIQKIGRALPKGIDSLSEADLLEITLRVQNACKYINDKARTVWQRLKDARKQIAQQSIEDWMESAEKPLSGVNEMDVACFVELLTNTVAKAPHIEDVENWFIQNSIKNPGGDTDALKSYLETLAANENGFLSGVDILPDDAFKELLHFSIENDRRPTKRLVKSWLRDNSKKLDLDEQQKKNNEVWAAIDACLNARKVQDFVLRMSNMQGLNNFAEQCSKQIAINWNVFDNDPWALNTPGGLYDLRTGECRPVRGSDYCTKITASAPDKNGLDKWLDNLNRCFPGDADSIRYLQEVAGVAVIGEVFDESLVVAAGTGGTGKSTVFNVLQKVLGKYAGSISPRILTGKVPNAGPALDAIRGLRFVLVSELGSYLSPEMLKLIVSTDTKSAEPKYKKPYEYVPTYTLLGYTNDLPNISALDEGTWRRICVVPFNNVVYNTDGEIKNYANVLFEEAGGAILWWMIQGAMRVYENNKKIKPCEVVINATKEYRLQQDWLAAYADDHLKFGDTEKIMIGELYTDFKNWWDNEWSDSHVPGRKLLVSKLQEKYSLEKCRDMYGMWLTGIGLRSHDSPQKK